MLFDKLRSHDPEKIALDDQQHILRYGDLIAEITKRRDQLTGVAVLAIALDNGVEWVLWDLAALISDTPCLPLPPFFTETQITHALQTAGVTHVISADGLNATHIPASDKLPANTAKVTFTSGTTGTAKGVCLPQIAMENVANSLISMLGDGYVGTHVCILPLAVLLENVAGVYAGLMAGCTIKLPSLTTFGQNYTYLHNHLAETAASSVILVPEILRLLMAQIAVKGPLPKLAFIAVGGSKIDPILIAQAHAMGLPVYEGYGLSEAASVIALNTPQHVKPGSVGRILDHVELTISAGEIQLKNPGFLGYIAESADGIFNTGDLGGIDDQGYLSITGRLKNVLITSYGRNISPEWVESVLLTQSDIAQIIVYGDAQPSLSAIIVPTHPLANIQAALDIVNQRLPDYARVQDFQLAPPFTITDNTLTGTGRPRRQVILNKYDKTGENACHSTID